MSRYYLIKNDLDLFLKSTAVDFKKSISKRVYASWQNRTDENYQKLIHMILDRSILDKNIRNDDSFDWKTSLNKLKDAGYVFDGSDYFPEKTPLYSLSRPEIVTPYLNMVKALKEMDVEMNESLLKKFIKLQQGNIHPEIIDFLKSFEVDIDEALLDAEIDGCIHKLTNSHYEEWILEDKSRLLDKKTIESVAEEEFEYILSWDDSQKDLKIKEYQKEQLIKVEKIRTYLKNTSLTKERVLELLNKFAVSYEKMNTYPEYHKQYFADICISFACANKLRTEAFYTDLQVMLIHEIENKYDVKFLDKHQSRYLNKVVNENEAAFEEVKIMVGTFLHDCFEKNDGNDKPEQLKKYRDIQTKKLQTINSYLQRELLPEECGWTLFNTLKPSLTKTYELLKHSKINHMSDLMSIRNDSKEARPEGIFTKEQIELIKMIEERFKIKCLKVNY